MDEQLTNYRSLKNSEVKFLLGIITFCQGKATFEEISFVSGLSKPTVYSCIQNLLIMELLNKEETTGILRYQVNKNSLLALGISELKNFFPSTTALNILNTINNSLNKAEASKNIFYEVNAQLLQKAGIGEPMRSRLADKDHVNPDYLKAHITAHKKAMKTNSRIGTGLLITKIRMGDEVPDQPETKDYTKW